MYAVRNIEFIESEGLTCLLLSLALTFVLGFFKDWYGETLNSSVISLTEK